MNRTEALAFIHATDWKGSRPGLARMTELMGRLENPQDGLRFIHVAGTNGKGSVCAMLSSILMEAGYRTGMYTSPHLVRINERMKINGTDISDESLTALAEKVKEAADTMADSPTEFEILTAMAFLYFKEQHCDIVVLEVGLGGRLDATNIIHAPEVAVICRIGLDHTEVLGNTLEQIAAEKAGIIKPGSFVVAYRGPKNVEGVFEETCRKQHAVLQKARFRDVSVKRQGLDGQSFCWEEFRDLRIRLLGRHQIKNAILVLETVRQLAQRGWKISENAVRSGLEHTQWPARLELLSREPVFLLDGAHNPQGVKALACSLRELFPGNKVVFLTGVLADKDYSGMMDLVLPCAKSFVCLTPLSGRALPAAQLRDHLLRKGAAAAAYADLEQGILAALSAAADSPVIAFGSLYIAGAVENAFHPAFRTWQRREKIAARDGLSSDVRCAFSDRIAQSILHSPEFSRAETILAYRAVKGEVNLDGFIAAAKAQGKRIVYPLCLEKGTMISLCPESEAAWKTGRYGIPEPVPEESQLVSPEELDFILCPCTVFDAQGNRMGMGGGYYDRYLPHCKNACVAAVAFEIQKVLGVAADSWDCPMQLVFTEKRVYRTPRF